MCLQLLVGFLDQRLDFRAFGGGSAIGGLLSLALGTAITVISNYAQVPENSLKNLSIMACLARLAGGGEGEGEREDEDEDEEDRAKQVALYLPGRGRAWKPRDQQGRTCQVVPPN